MVEETDSERGWALLWKELFRKCYSWEAIPEPFGDICCYSFSQDAAKLEYISVRLGGSLCEES